MRSSRNLHRWADLESHNSEFLSLNFELLAFNPTSLTFVIPQTDLPEILDWFTPSLV
jgi:hypothetical protein